METPCGMPESAPRNELELIDLGEWGRIFGPEQLVQIHERQLGETECGMSRKDLFARHGPQPTIGCAPTETDRSGPPFPI